MNIRGSTITDVIYVKGVYEFNETKDDHIVLKRSTQTRDYETIIDKATPERYEDIMDQLYDEDTWITTDREI